ncbi:MAG: hypothetical protein AAFY76_09870 [Cyanobacteria bacterium J06649_11]
MNFNEYLASLDLKTSKQELSSLYKNFEVVRDFFNMKLSQGKIDNRTIRKYKDRIIDALYPDSDFEGGLDIERVGAVMKQIGKNPNYYYFIKIGLFAIEECTRVANQYGGSYGEEFYEYFEDLFKEVVKVIVREGLQDELRIQVESVVNGAFEGYGHYDQLLAIYEEEYK